MKHAGQAALDRLEPLLRDLRRRAGLKEKSRGIFYRGSRAFLHFHEHGEALFADLRTAEDFERLPVLVAAERRALLARVDGILGDGAGAKRR